MFELQKIIINGTPTRSDPNGCELGKNYLIADLGKTETIFEVFTPHSKAERKRYIGIIN